MDMSVIWPEAEPEIQEENASRTMFEDNGYFWRTVPGGVLANL